MTIPSDDDLAELLGPEPVAVNWLHQQKEFDEHKDDRARLLLWSMRTGKSKAVIDKFEYQFSQGAIEGVILLAPNGIHTNWTLNEIPRWSQLDYRSFAWETPKRADFDRIAAFKAMCEWPGMKWLAINMEALAHPDCIEAIKVFKRACNKRIGFAISEAHHFGHAGAKRTRLARGLGRLAQFVTLETGTAILNSPLRAYAILKILDDLALGPQYAGDTYEKFVQHHCEFEVDERTRGRRRAYKKIKGYKNLDELRDTLARWGSVVLREDVGDMTQLLETERPVVMSDKQRVAYLEMVSRHLLEIGDDEVAAPDGGARMMKLQQILDGYVMDDGVIHNIDDTAPIYRAVWEEVAGTLPGKSIVWCRYREDIRRVVTILRRNKIRTLEFHGDIPLNQREPVRLAFQTDPKYTCLVGQYAAGGEGRDFSAADAVIFFSSTPNAIHYNQAKERGSEKGGRPVTLVRIRTRGTVDDRNWEILDGKWTLADSVSGRGLRDLLMRTDV